MLWEEVEKYTKLTGEDGTHVPIMKLGAYLDGYEKGTEVLDKIRAEILDNAFTVVNPHNTNKYINVIELDSIDEIFDKYKEESEE